MQRNGIIGVIIMAWQSVGIYQQRSGGAYRSMAAYQSERRAARKSKRRVMAIK